MNDKAAVNKCGGQKTHTKRRNKMTNNIELETTSLIRAVYEMLKNREIQPSGSFVSGGKFYAYNVELINVCAPSISWPLSELEACITIKYVKAVQAKYGCKTLLELKTAI